MKITFDKYHTYDEIRDFLQECVMEYPDLCRIECIGWSRENREIRMIEITNKNTGPGKDKPGIYTDGNTHAGEVTGCEVVLYTIKRILEGYGKDPQITHLVDTRVFYFVPRITVDGSELYLTTPQSVRSSVHPWPKEEDTPPGLHPQDIDGDGKILRMRVKNPDGAWRISSKDPRLMLPRKADDMGLSGEIFYDVYSEGLIHEYDSDEPVKQAPGKYRLDFNRHFPANWELPVRQPGSGDYPFSEPELKAIGDFFLAHPNIVTSMAYHTSGGFFLRPPANQPDRALDQRDLSLYKTLGDLGKELTGYRLVSVFEEFAWDPQRPPVGSSLEWAYESLGVLAFETELWDMQGRAGIARRSMQQRRNMTAEEQEADSLKLLEWNDEEMGGALHYDWRPFDHPQLGEVEIGGWEPKFGRQNPPLGLLEEECKRNAPFNLTRAAVTPRLVIEKAEAQCLAQGVYKVTVVVKNEGYLPTYGTYRALRVGQAKPVSVTLSGASPRSGKAQESIGHLGGRAGGGDSRRKLEWVVDAKEGSVITIEAKTPKAGLATTEIAL